LDSICPIRFGSQWNDSTPVDLDLDHALWTAHLKFANDLLQQRAEGHICYPLHRYPVPKASTGEVEHIVNEARHPIDAALNASDHVLTALRESLLLQ
jgi:hypothetical protein